MKNGNDFLYEYWKKKEFEIILPYNQASNKEKLDVKNTLDFGLYILNIRIQELKEEIYLILPKWIYKLLKG